MKYFYSTLLAVGLSIPAFAATSVPIGVSEKPSFDPKYAGVSTCEITNATGTSALLCTTGSGIILDIVGSSVATTDPIVMRDSATANTTSTVLYTIDQKSIATTRVYPRFKNGLSVNAMVAAPASSGTNASRPAWVIVYTKDIY